MKTLLLFVISLFFFSISNARKREAIDLVIANGKMPNIASDKNNAVHLVYGMGDSIMYVYSKNGTSFTTPSLVAVLPNLFASAMRGPQIAATDNGVIVTASNKKGNIFSYRRTKEGDWSKARKVNDIDESAKEALMALSADGKNVFAVWLGAKSTKGQNVYGAKSIDGGNTWSRNVIVYASADSTVCECCKPSVTVKGNNVYAMFRNWLNGSRDLYVIKSSNGGKSFEHAQKLGVGTWKLDGCPMDGGGLAVNKNGEIQTVWRRENKIFASAAGNPEIEIGAGKGCTIETLNGTNVYAWTENGKIVVLNKKGQKKVLGTGSQPLLKALNDKEVICVWQSESQIHSSVVLL